MNEPLKIITGTSDQELANDLRKRMQAALVPVCEIMREADQAGLELNFNIGRDQYGRRNVAALTIVRPL